MKKNWNCNCGHWQIWRSYKEKNKVNNEKRKICKICSAFTIRTKPQCHWHFFLGFAINLKHVSISRLNSVSKHNFGEIFPKKSSKVKLSEKQLKFLKNRKQRPTNAFLQRKTLGLSYSHKFRGKRGFPNFFNSTTSQFMLQVLNEYQNLKM